jgi:hypothetical protein
VKMPEWAAPKGPWCLKQWVPYREPNPEIGLCILAPDHTGDCRLTDGRYISYDEGMLVGQARMKRDDEVSLQFYESDH